MDYVAALSTFGLGLVSAVWAIQLITDGIKDGTWNHGLTTMCALIILSSFIFLGTAVCLLISGPRLLPPSFY